MDEKDTNEIPLTEEIMYENTYDEPTCSYRVYVGNGVVQYALSDTYIVRYYPEMQKFVYEGIELKTVADLQMLVKLMRINREIIYYKKTNVS